MGKNPFCIIFFSFLQTNRFINIDFACLEATINLQTWVVLLDFLGMGAKVHDPTMTDPLSQVQSEESAANSFKQGMNFILHQLFFSFFFSFFSTFK